MTQIKDDNGNWIVVAGGQRTWVGTKEALQTALNNSEIPNGTPVMVTNDYAEVTEIVDVVENNNMKAITSNAVYDAINTVQSGTGTRNTSYVSSDGFYCVWYKVGRICTVNIQYNLLQLTPSSVNIITGLPRPITELACVGEGSDNTHVSGFVIQGDGSVRTHYDGASGQFVHGTATYITAG